MAALLSDLLAVPSALQLELDRYLHELIRSCEASEDVVAGQQLSRWFVRPTLAAWVDARRAGAEEVVAGEHRVCLLGEAGSGKTTLLRWLCAREAKALLEMSPHARLPLWVNARVLPLEAETDRSPITPEYFSSVSHGALWPAVLRSFWQEGRVLVLCDGLDALPRRRAGQKPYTARLGEWFWWAGQFWLGRGGVPGNAAAEGFDLIATSRPVGEAVHLDPRFCHDILSWTEVQIRQYLTTCFPGESSWTELLARRLGNGCSSIPTTFLGTAARWRWRSRPANWLASLPSPSMKLVGRGASRRNGRGVGRSACRNRTIPG